MAESHFESQQYTSHNFVESAGGVLFHLSSRTVGLVMLDLDNYVLPKGRRNCGETRRETALREVTEETGLPCRLLPVNMRTRTPPAVETEQLDDRSSFYTDICEPFTLQIRHLGQSEVKLIWWFAIAVDEEVLPEETTDDISFVAFFSYTEVLKWLTFPMDRDVVRKAIELVENTHTE